MWTGELCSERSGWRHLFVPRYPQPCGSSAKGAGLPGAPPVAFLPDTRQVAAGGGIQVRQPPQQVLEVTPISWNHHQALGGSSPFPTCPLSLKGIFTFEIKQRRARCCRGRHLRSGVCIRI